MHPNVYTAIAGGKDSQRDDVICLKGYSHFKNPARNAKIYKVLSHLFINEPWSVWIDGNITLKVEPEELLVKLGDAEIGVFTHPERQCLYDEAVVCKKWAKDDSKTIDEQIGRYMLANFPHKYGLAACGVIVRRHTDKIKRLNEQWWSEICRGSVRDQISFPYVYRENIKFFEKVNLKDNRYFHRVGHII